MRSAPERRLCTSFKTWSSISLRDAVTDRSDQAVPVWRRALGALSEVRRLEYAEGGRPNDAVQPSRKRRRRGRRPGP